MIILGGLLVGLIAIVVAFLVIGRIIQTLGLVVLMLVAVCLVAIVYICLAIGGITLSVLYQLWGSDNMGWAFAAATTVALISGWLMLKTVVREIRTAPERVRGWFGRSSTSQEVISPTVKKEKS